MERIATYVFLDLETTGLPHQELNKTKITELSMVAVKRDHLLETPRGSSPRVQHKLTLCFNPGRMIQPAGSKITGLTNELLEYEPRFTKDTFNMINTFLNVLTKPVCLIAQNGENFDFPILKNHFEKIGENLPSDLMCADCYHAFYDILEAVKHSPVDDEVSVKENKDTSTTDIQETIVVNDEEDLYNVADTLQMKIQNETTPKRQETRSVPIANTPKKDNINSHYRHNKVRRKLPFSSSNKHKLSYKLKDIYYRLLNKPAVDAHRAENDCILALECSVAIAKQFVEWVDKNHRPFHYVNPMTLGVPLGD